MGPVVDHSPPQMGHPDDKVEIYPQKMGLEGDLGQKQQ